MAEHCGSGPVPCGAAAVNHQTAGLFHRHTQMIIKCDSVMEGLLQRTRTHHSPPNSIHKNTYSTISSELHATKTTSFIFPLQQSPAQMNLPLKYCFCQWSLVESESDSSCQTKRNFKFDLKVRLCLDPLINEVIVDVSSHRSMFLERCSQSSSSQKQPL